MHVLGGGSIKYDATQYLLDRGLNTNAKDKGGITGFVSVVLCYD